MTCIRHEVPTHLNVEDRVLFGLTVRQLLYLLVGSSASYALWEQLSASALPIRIACTAVCVGVTLAFALLRLGGRPLEEWLVALLVFLGTPRQAIWRPRAPVAAEWRPAGGGWQELAPSPVWAEDDRP
jgi:hypothetical protein